MTVFTFKLEEDIQLKNMKKMWFIKSLLTKTVFAKKEAGLIITTYTRDQNSKDLMTPL